MAAIQDLRQLFELIFFETYGFSFPFDLGGLLTWILIWSSGNQNTSFAFSNQSVMLSVNWVEEFQGYGSQNININFNGAARFGLL